MKRYLKALLAVTVAMSLAIGGNSIPASAATSASSVDQWDSDTEQSYEYEEDEIVLMETDLVRISAAALTYKSSKNGMALNLTARVENLSGGDIRIITYPEGTLATGCNFTVEAGETRTKAVTDPTYEWNCLVGDTDDCFQGKYLLKVISESNRVDSVQFDWYASENSPFVNISSVESDDYGEDLEYFNFRQSAEMTEFMQQYDPDVVPEWNETKWTINGELISLQGNLTPDEERFINLAASIRGGNGKSKMSDEEVAETLLSFYDDFTDKTGLRFDGAEECISEKLFTEDGDREAYFFTSGGYELTINCDGKNSTLYYSKEYREYGEIPYAIDDALAYVQADGGEEAECTRRVEFGNYRSTALESPYYVYITLDDDERIVSVDAQYDMSFSGDEEKTEENELAREFFEDLSSFFLNGKVNEESLEYIQARYESDPDSNTAYRIGWDYTVQLSFARNNSKFSIDVNGDAVPQDAQAFPDEEEQDALQLDPLARIGIDKDIAVPETVLFEQDDMRIVLERVLYTTVDMELIIRMENIPDDLNAVARLEELNGSELWRWEDTRGTVDSCGLTAGEPHEPVMTDEIWISIRDIRKNIPDFSGISSLKVDAYCARYEGGNATPERIGENTVVIEAEN